jgi:nicotinamide-nucleotide amidase
MTAEILCVGTELLLGDIVNSNAQFLSRELASLGINVFYQSVVGDNRQRLRKAFEVAFSRADAVITSGGLGPTDDDLTKETGAEYFSKKLVTNKEIVEKLKNYFIKSSYPMTKNNFKQADFPEGSTIIKNDNGTAPGCMIEQDGKTLIMLPGPPGELTPMFINEVKPILAKKSGAILVSKTLRFCGIGESALEDKIKPILDRQTNPTIALYAKTFEVHVRITASVKTPEEAEPAISAVENEIRETAGEYVYGINETTLEKTVVELLKSKNKKLTVAESVTGGEIVRKLINVPSASEVLNEGLVTYSNESKIKRLGVKKETLEKFGAVSAETAREMAEGAAQTADIGIATTGIAGPDGGSPEKPVGLVYIAAAFNGKTEVKEYQYSGGREKIRVRAAVAALDALRKKLSNDQY